MDWRRHGTDARHQFVILTSLTASALSGTFSGLPNGNSFTVGLNQQQINYLANGVMLAVVHEPATWALVGSALVPLFLRRRLHS